MNPKLIERINELSKKSKAEGLTQEETIERQTLREEYIKAFKGNLQSTLDTIVIVDKDGNRKELKQFNKN